MGQIREYKCPSCGGVLHFDSTLQKMRCEYCGTELEVEAVEEYNEQLNDERPDSFNWDIETGSEWAADENSNMRTYLCESCGGEIMADESTAATSCPFCGSPVVLMEQVTGALRPDFVIPFKLDKEAAKEAYRNHLKGKILLPKQFKDENHIDEIKGMYVPFWLFDASAEAMARYQGTRTTTWQDRNYIYTRTSYYSIFRDGQMKFEHVPADGSSRMADDMMEAIEPFNFDEAVDFKTAYLSGYLADRYDVSAEGTVRDTLYIVKVKENPVYSFSETGTAKVGEGYTWHETTYETPATGTFNYELPFRSIYGCDSIYHLTLTVTKADREEIPVELVFCEGDSAEYRGVVYTKAGQYPVYAEGAVRDTIYNVQVAVNQPSETFDEMTIVYGEDKTWNGIALKDSTVGVHTVVYTTTNIAGCDSVVTLALTVQKMDVLTLEQTLEFCEGDTVAYRDVAYYEAGVDTIEISGEVRDTMIVVTVTVWEKTYAEILVTDTVGNTIELPEGEWLLGEEVVSGTYELQEADTMGLEFVQYGETSHGCEAVTKLIVTVEERPMSEGIEDVFVEQAAKKFFRNGAIYIRRQDMLFGIDGKRVE